MNSRSPEFTCFVVVLFSLNILVQSLFAAWSSSFWLMLFLELLIVSMSLELGELIGAAIVSKCDLTKLDRLERQPSVAILFLVYDDIVDEALAAIGRQTYPRSDVFILDDSNDARNRSVIDRTNLQVVRRGAHTGHKAGSLNNWLKLHGSAYEYFLVLDSDSMIPDDFVESIVKYAEHPANTQVAIFNSLAECWNTDSQFPRLLAAINPLKNWMRIRLANRSHSLLSSGHNNLHRTRAVIEVGGFDEDFIAEDIAVTLKLIRAGYTSKLVNLISYEVEPEHIFSYVQRLNRWARQTVQIQRADWRKIPLSVRFQMFKLTWIYLGFFLYPVWAVLIAWGTKSSVKDIQLLVAIFFHGRPAVIVPFVIAGSLPLIVPILKIPLLIKLRVPLRDYLGSFLLSLAIAFYAMFTVCAHQLRAATSETLEFDVTDKRSRRVTLHSILLSRWYLIPFWIFIAAGFWQNPMALVLSALWTAIFILAPLLIYLFHKPRSIESRV